MRTDTDGCQICKARTVRPGDGSNNDDLLDGTFDPLEGFCKCAAPCPDAVGEIGPPVMRSRHRGAIAEDEAFSTAIFVEGKDSIERHTREDNGR